VLPRGGAGQQQDGHIAATDEQQQGNRAEEQVQCPAKPLKELVVEAFDMDLEAPNREMGWSFFCELFHQGLERGVGLGMRDARFKACLYVEGIAGILNNLQGDVDVGVIPCEARSGHSHDGVVLVNHLHGSSHDRGIAVEVTLPELMAEDDDRLRILPIDGIGGLQAASQKCGDTKKIEGIGAEEIGFNVLGHIAAGDGQAPVVGKKGVLNDRRVTNLLPLRRGHTEPSLAAVFVEQAEVNHAVGSSVRVGIEENRIDDAENGSRGSDAEGEGNDGRQGEPR
jgi:hypothetical protein